jgi:hypothetical protein
MNSLDDLRATLDRHAGDLDEVAVGPVRAAAVRHRVRAVRRRRRAAVAGGAVAVLAVVGGVAALPDPAGPDAEPAATVVGVRPPAELTSLGFTYAFSEGVDGEDGTAVLRLPASDEPRLVSWATSGDDDVVRISAGSGAAPITYTDADFAGWTVVAEGARTTVRATVADPAAGDPGLAVYTLTDKRPAGVTKDGVTFRQQTADGTLIDAVVGDPGQNEVTVSGVTGAEGVGYSYYCAGGPPDAVLNIAYDDRPALEVGGCDDTVQVDPAARGGSSTATRPGEQVVRTLYVTDGSDGPRVVSDELRLGIGMYDLSPYGGVDDFMAPRFEHDGHLWGRTEIVAGRAADGRLVATAPDDGSAVLALAEAATAAGEIEIAFEGDPSRFVTNFGGGTWQLVSPGDRVTVTSTGASSPDAPLRVAFYERLD